MSCVLSAWATLQVSEAFSFISCFQSYIQVRFKHTGLGQQLSVELLNQSFGNMACHVFSAWATLQVSEALFYILIYLFFVCLFIFVFIYLFIFALIIFLCI